MLSDYTVFYFEQELTSCDIQTLAARISWSKAPEDNLSRDDDSIESNISA